jgi:hypothetical protein
MTDDKLIDFKAKREAREQAEIDLWMATNFNCIMCDVFEEARNLFVLSTLHTGSLGLGQNLTDNQLAERILAHAAKIHEFANKLLAVAIKEDKGKAS